MGTNQSRSNQRMKLAGIFLVTIAMIIFVTVVAAASGGLEVSFGQLLRGLIYEYDPDVAIIYQLRFPRIVIALTGGALLAVSGLLIQVVMRNPLADPGLIGVNAGASILPVIAIFLFPRSPVPVVVYAFLGGLGAFAFVYQLAGRNHASPTRLILIGIAVNAMLTGLLEAINTMGGNQSVTKIAKVGISLHSWKDVKIMMVCMMVLGVAAVILPFWCNLLTLSDDTVYSLGISVGQIRFLLSLTAVLFASLFTAVVGPISFLGLLVPHLSRLLVGSDHKILIPYCGLLGGLIFLSADTCGRLLAYPYEISPAIVMSIIGGPTFIVLLKRSRQIYE